MCRDCKLAPLRQPCIADTPKAWWESSPSSVSFASSVRCMSWHCRRGTKHHAPGIDDTLPYGRDGTPSVADAITEAGERTMQGSRTRPAGEGAGRCEGGLEK